MKRLFLPMALLMTLACVGGFITRGHWLPMLMSDHVAGGNRPRVQAGVAGLETGDVSADSTSVEPPKLVTSREAGQGARPGALPSTSESAGTSGAAGAQGRPGGGKSAPEKGSASSAQPGGAKPAETKKQEPKRPAPPPAVESEEGKQLNAELDGYFQEASPARLKGFAFDTIEREAALQVAIYIDEARACELTCDRREEHKTHGVIWHFEQLLPEGLQDGEQHRVRAYAFRKDKPGRKELRWSPRDVKPNSFPTGKLEEATPEKGISGYAWDPDETKTAVLVRVKIDGVQIAEVKAGRKNELLAQRKIAPHDACAFMIEWPEVLDDGREHTVQALAVDLATGTEVELPGSPRVIADRGGVANRAPLGAFDICNKVVLAGWAWDEDAPSSPVQVEIWLDDELFTTLSADSKRDGLKWSNVTPDPNHGWVMTTPGVLLDNRTHVIRAFAVNIPAGVKVELQGSPKTYRREENSAPMGSYWYADENRLRGWAADPDLGSEPCDIEIYIDGKLWTRVKADARDNSLVGTGYAPNAEHGFDIVPPDSVRDGKVHDVTIYAVNSPEGPPTNLGTRTIGKNSIIAGFWVQDKLLDTRVEKGLYVTSVSPWFDAYHKDVKVGDVLVEFDGKAAGEGETTAAKFYEWLQTKKKDDVVRFKFWRNGSFYEADIKLGQTIGS